MIQDRAMISLLPLLFSVRLTRTVKGTNATATHTPHNYLSENLERIYKEARISDLREVTGYKLNPQNSVIPAMGIQYILAKLIAYRTDNKTKLGNTKRGYQGMGWKDSLENQCPSPDHIHRSSLVIAARKTHK